MSLSMFELFTDVEETCVRWISIISWCAPSCFSCIFPEFKVLYCICLWCKCEDKHGNHGEFFSDSTWRAFQSVGISDSHISRFSVSQCANIEKSNDTIEKRFVEWI